MVALSDRSLMTADEYFLWESRQEERYEYWDGELVAMSGGTRAHNRVCGNFFSLLDNALIDRECDVYINDVKLQVEPGQKYFYPDVVVTCDNRDDNDLFVQFPSLIIEVLSPSTEAVDRGFKFARYRQFTTLQEYILVSASSPLVEVFRRNDKGQWVLSEYNIEDRLILESLGVEIAIVDLYRQVKFETDRQEA
jgi:Uma2 family endonuclease